MSPVLQIKRQGSKGERVLPKASDLLRSMKVPAGAQGAVVRARDDRGRKPRNAQATGSACQAMRDKLGGRHGRRGLRTGSLELPTGLPMVNRNRPGLEGWGWLVISDRQWHPHPRAVLPDSSLGTGRPRGCPLEDTQEGAAVGTH